VEEFVKQLGNRRIPQDSIMLLYSASHLGAVGLAAYAEDLVEAAAALRGKLGRDTRIGPLPPMLLAVCQDQAIIRAIHELIKWTYDFYCREDDYLEESTCMAINIINADGEEFVSEREERRIRLPGRDGMERQIWRSGGTDLKIHAKVRPISLNKEKELITSIIAEIRDKQAINMDPARPLRGGWGSRGYQSSQWNSCWWGAAMLRNSE
jgi:hypothetical protein